MRSIFTHDMTITLRLKVTNGQKMHKVNNTAEMAIESTLSQ